jgi:hypothetical protein
MPGARCTRSLACDENKHTSVVTTGSDGFTRHSNGFNAYTVLSSVSEFLVVTVICGLRFCLMPGWATSLRKFNTSNGCQNHTASQSATSAVRLRAIRQLTGPMTRPAIP